MNNKSLIKKLVEAFDFNKMRSKVIEPGINKLYKEVKRKSTPDIIYNFIASHGESDGLFIYEANNEEDKEKKICPYIEVKMENGYNTLIISNSDISALVFTKFVTFNNFIQLLKNLNINKIGIEIHISPYFNNDEFIEENAKLPLELDGMSFENIHISNTNIKSINSNVNFNTLILKDCKFLDEKQIHINTNNLFLQSIQGYSNYKFIHTCNLLRLSLFMITSVQDINELYKYLPTKQNLYGLPNIKQLTISVRDVLKHGISCIQEADIHFSLKYLPSTVETVTIYLGTGWLSSFDISYIPTDIPISIKCSDLPGGYFFNKDHGTIHCDEIPEDVIKVLQRNKVKFIKYRPSSFSHIVNNVTNADQKKKITVQKELNDIGYYIR